MDFLSINLSSSSSSPLRLCTGTRRPEAATSNIFNFLQISLHNSHSLNTRIPISHISTFPPISRSSHLYRPSLKSHTATILLGDSSQFSAFADELTPEPPTSDKISLESVIISMDNFIIRYPYFVFTVFFIWLVAIPLFQASQRKYKYISAIDAFPKLRIEPDVQLLDIRDKKSVQFLCTPNIKIYNKTAMRVYFSEDMDEGLFLRKVLQKFPDHENTTVCILDNFEGNSFKVAEILSKNGFKQAYAIKGGVRGQNGWQEMQEALLPPSVHVRRKKKKKVKKSSMSVESSIEIDVENGAMSSKEIEVQNGAIPSENGVISSKEIEVQNGAISSSIVFVGEAKESKDEV